MIGTEITPLTIALRTSALIGSTSKAPIAEPIPVARDDDQVEAARLVEAAREPGLPAEQLAHRVGGRAGEHRHGEQAGADDAEPKTRNANAPATGRSASAACAAVWTSTMPRWLSVTAVATTMQSATRFEKPMPTTVSSLMRRRCLRT